MKALPSPDHVFQFWFDGADRDPMKAAARAERWFGSAPAFDQEIRSRFGALVEAARHGELEPWRHQPLSCLAYILVCDQFPRNMFRGTARAFAWDARALSACLQGIQAGLDRTLTPVSRGFFYLPMEHSEDLQTQKRSVETYQQLSEEADERFRSITANHVAYAREHHDIVARFGRFPHRNSILDRTSTPEEITYLADGGATFGQ